MNKRRTTSEHVLNLPTRTVQTLSSHTYHAIFIAHSQVKHHKIQTKYQKLPTRSAQSVLHTRCVITQKKAVLSRYFQFWNKYFDWPKEEIFSSRMYSATAMDVSLNVWYEMALCVSSDVTAIYTKWKPPSCKRLLIVWRDVPCAHHSNIQVCWSVKDRRFKKYRKAHLFQRGF